MKTIVRAAATAFAVAAIAAPLGAASPTVGAQVPDFRLTDMNGRNVELGQFRGRTVVLEWHNPGCPFVKKHYDSGNMQRTQQAARGQGVVWLTINSGAPGKQGHMNGQQAQAMVQAANAQPTHYLLDPRGVVGKAFDAKTTPHMYIIDGTGKLVYNGGIDDKPTANQADIAGARNHVTAALDDLRAGRAVQVSETRPYGCSVKYPDA